MNLVNLSEGSFLALHSLALIAQKQPERLTVKALAEELQASQAHLAKVFQKLSKAELVTAVRGPTGGFVLNKDPQSISFLEIYEVMEGKIDTSGCPLGKEFCAFSKCIFNKEVHRISSDIYDSYKKIKLSDCI